jgi:hypothetical protein
MVKGVSGHLGLPVEPDLYFRPQRFSELKRVANASLWGDAQRKRLADAAVSCLHWRQRQSLGL